MSPIDSNTSNENHTLAVLRQLVCRQCYSHLKSSAGKTGVNPGPDQNLAACALPFKLDVICKSLDGRVPPLSHNLCAEKDKCELNMVSSTISLPQCGDQGKTEDSQEQDSYRSSGLPQVNSRISHHQGQCSLSVARAKTFNSSSYTGQAG